ncbi:N-acyl-D-amino-acid deacylase family protein [Undibacterium sp. Di24W]
MSKKIIAACLGCSLGLILPSSAQTKTTAPEIDLILHNGVIYDGSGSLPYRGQIAIRGDKIVYVGTHRKMTAKSVIDVKGKAIAPGFINMLSHMEESVFIDGRALSDLAQGVTLEVLGEDSMGPIPASVQKSMEAAQGDIKYKVNWTSFGEYLKVIEQRGLGPNVAALVGAGTVRNYVLGSEDIAANPTQLQSMRKLVRQAMREGALGLTTALIYVPNTFATTEELIALAKESATCGGIFSAHMRSEGDRIEAAVDEMITIAKASKAPVEIYHLKFAGKDNWHKIDPIIKKIEAARAQGLHITADMYTYTAGATGLDAAMPSWVQAGGLAAWIKRLQDPATRAKVIAEMRNPHPKDWENLYGGASAEGTMLLGFKTAKLKPLTGKSLAQVAKERGVSPEDIAVDLVIEDGSRIEVAYFLMDEKNLRKQVALPWVSFGSDAAGAAPNGIFLQASAHPRTYGNFARVFAQYVRKDKVLSIQEAVRKLSALPASTLSIKDRGSLQSGNYADVVVFDPEKIQDHATFSKPHQLATGVEHVLVNGKFALRDGIATGVATGRIIKGSAANAGSKEYAACLD